ncbi:hypothetical protein ACTQ49_14280 [Luteococcus sp. Sow4_B9]|uniref:hypothetical protein n=1 Tax=Luteococcus sp. Sow4_B9 TaxID=3438792 RepID=UPI003F9822D6
MPVPALTHDFEELLLTTAAAGSAGATLTLITRSSAVIAPRLCRRFCTNMLTPIRNSRDASNMIHDDELRLEGHEVGTEPPYVAVAAELHQGMQWATELLLRILPETARTPAGLVELIEKEAGISHSVAEMVLYQPLESLLPEAAD